jgi:outer membrane protein TolC
MVRPQSVLALLSWYAWTASPSFARQTARAVTLGEAIELAQTKDPNVVKARGDIAAARATKRAGYGAFLPSLSLRAGGGSSFSEFPRIDPRTGQLVSANNTTNSINVELDASVDLFTGFRRGADLRAARAQITQAEAELDQARWQTAYNVSNEFFNALLNTELLRVRKEQLRRAQQQLTIAMARLVTRGAPVSDSLQAVVEASQARLQLLNQESLVARAEANLARAVGVPGRMGAAPDSSLEVRPIAIDTTTLLAEATQRSPAVLYAEAGLKAAEANLASQKTAYWPQVGLSAFTNYGGNDQDPSNRYRLFNNRNLNLGVSLPIFNGFQREQQIASRQATVDQAVAVAADRRREIEANLIAQLSALGTARERIALAETSLTAARANSAVQLERYRLGTGTVLELVQAQDRLSRAEEEAVSARFDYLRAKAQIETLIGRKL